MMHELRQSPLCAPLTYDHSAAAKVLRRPCGRFLPSLFLPSFLFPSQTSPSLPLSPPPFSLSSSSQPRSFLPLEVNPARMSETERVLHVSWANGVWGGGVPVDPPRNVPPQVLGRSAPTPHIQWRRQGEASQGTFHGPCKVFSVDRRTVGQVKMLWQSSRPILDVEMV